VRFDIEFFGHENVRSLHQKTIEITKEKHLTPSGDCIVGVNARYGCNDIPGDIKEKLQNPTSKIKFSILVEKHVFEINGFGNNHLTLTHPNDIVIRKSSFVCTRTLGIKCDQASDSIPRVMVELLQNPSQKGIFRIDVD